jgi:RND family efflux transporter MFP subunit
VRGNVLKIWLPISVLASGLLLGVGLVNVSPAVETSTPEPRPPLVRTVEARPEPMTLFISAQGTVVPRTESDLVAEVSGRITSVSPRLAPGGFIEAGEVLVQIDSRDYEVAVRRAEAAVGRADSELDLARSRLERRENLADRGVGSSDALDDAQNTLRVSQAAQIDASAALEQARRDLARTHILAPFAGRVREKLVGVGQFVTRGSSLARVYAVDYAEVRLPIPDSDAAFVDLPIAYRDGAEPRLQPSVVLSTRFAGREYQWKGQIVRTEGEIDSRTRMIHAVARVENPYGRGDDPNRPPLAVGMFVHAKIEGRHVEAVASLPRSALRGANQVAVVDSEGRLRLREVEVLQQEADRVLIRDGVSPGESVVTSPLPISVDGMLVQIERDESTLETLASGPTSIGDRSR